MWCMGIIHFRLEDYRKCQGLLTWWTDQQPPTGQAKTSHAVWKRRNVNDRVKLTRSNFKPRTPFLDIS